MGASTDASLRAEMLSYSRSRGLFAGVSLEGTSLRPDDDANAEIYGRKLTAREIVRGTSNTVPVAGRRLVEVSSGWLGPPCRNQLVSTSTQDVDGST